jgi:two-component system nitrate/nitrite response regulator NarL
MASPERSKPSLGNIACAPPPIEAIRIGVFDANPLFRAGIVHVLSAAPGMEVIVESGSALDALRLGAGPSLDVVILDADLLAADTNLCRSISAFFAFPNILVMSLTPDQEQAQATFAAGARGYLLKGVSASEFLEAVRALHRHEGYVSPALGAMILADASLSGRVKGTTTSPLGALTFREGEIFTLLAGGLKNREIGRRLGVAEKTIKRYVTRIFEKLHVRNRVEAAMLSRSVGRHHLAPTRWRTIAAPPLSPKENGTTASRAVDLVGATNGSLPARKSGPVSNA